MKNHNPSWKILQNMFLTILLNIKSKINNVLILGSYFSNIPVNLNTKNLNTEIKETIFENINLKKDLIMQKQNNTIIEKCTFRNILLPYKTSIIHSMYTFNTTIFHCVFDRCNSSSPFSYAIQSGIYTFLSHVNVTNSRSNILRCEKLYSLYSNFDNINSYINTISINFNCNFEQCKINNSRVEYCQFNYNKPFAIVIMHSDCYFTVEVFRSHFIASKINMRSKNCIISYKSSFIDSILVDNYIEKKSNKPKVLQYSPVTLSLSFTVESAAEQINTTEAFLGGGIFVTSVIISVTISFMFGCSNINQTAKIGDNNSEFFTEKNQSEINNESES